MVRWVCKNRIHAENVHVLRFILLPLILCVGPTVCGLILCVGPRPTVCGSNSVELPINLFIKM